MLMNKSKKKGILAIISVFMLMFCIFTLSTKLIQKNNFDLNENSKNFETSGSIVENPIFINGSATGLSAHNWTWAEEQFWCGGSGTSIDPYFIENLLVDGNNQSNCIEIHNSAKYLIIRDCTVFNSRLNESDPGAGFFLVNVTNLTLIDNECDYNAYGVFMEQSSYNNITGNSASFNTWSGFYFSLCVNNTMSKNVANNNIGVQFESMGINLRLCDFNLVFENIAKNNKYGIWLSGSVSIWGSHNNTIINNTASYNEIGIALFGDFGRCYNNTLSGNVVSNNIDYGIRVSRSPQNIFRKNTVKNNENDGIYTYKESNNNTFSENAFIKNGMTGLNIGYQSYWNLIYYNCFSGNGLNAQDDGTSNEWDNEFYGNYWDNYTGLDTDHNGIGDVSYNISGIAENQDRFPLMKCPFSIYQDTGGFPFELIILISVISGGAVIGVATLLLIRRKRK